MLRRFAVLSAAAVVVLMCEDRATGPIAAETALPLLKSIEPAEFCMRPDLTYAEQAAAQRGSGPTGALAVPADWPGKDVPGGDVPPTRIVADPYPTFDGIAVDPENDARRDERREPQRPAHVRPQQRQPARRRSPSRSGTSSARAPISDSSPA